MRGLLFAVVVVLTLASAGVAQAGTLSVAPEEATYSATAGETNRVFLVWGQDGLWAIDVGAPVTAGAGCVSIAPNEAFCADVPSGTDLLVTTEDMNDYVDTGAASLPQRIEGGDGNDTLDSGFQFGAVLDGGPGADVFQTSGGTVDYSSRTNPLTITVGDDLPNDGEAGENDFVPDGVAMIFAGDGADTISLDDGGGGDGQVWVFGHGGNDELTASVELARLLGGSGEDHLEAPTARSILFGGGGNDVAIGGEGSQHVSGGSGADLVRTGRGRDSLTGGTGDDELIGGKGYDIMRGAEGDDTLRARDGRADLLRGQADFDRARVDKGLDTVFSVEKLF